MGGSVQLALIDSFAYGHLRLQIDSPMGRNDVVGLGSGWLAAASLPPLHGGSACKRRRSAAAIWRCAMVACATLGRGPLCYAIVTVVVRSRMCDFAHWLRLMYVSNAHI